MAGTEYPEYIGERQDDEPRLYGVKEAAAALGVRGQNLRVVSGLPEPYDVIAATPLYRAVDIEALAGLRKRIGLQKPAKLAA